jgi:hypothetical protein
MKHSFKTMLLAVLVAGSTLAGCARMPTENQSVVDQRPQISFQLGSDAQGAARVLVDRLDMGAAGDFATGKAALRVLPGTHLVEVRLGSAVLLNERVYLADGVARAFRLN